MQTSRRGFLAAVGAFALAPLARTEPDLILYNGNVWTVDPKLPRAQAVAVSSGRFLAVGSNDEVLALATPAARKIDLGWKTVLPGFNDAHSHPCASGVDHLRMVACDNDSIVAIESALRERAEHTAPGKWVLGFLYDDGKTPRPINRHDLDAAVPDRPVLVHHRGGHTVFVNSLALKTAEVTDGTADPPGGRFEHDSSGHLTGFVGDAAVSAFEKFIVDNPSREDFRKGAALISKMFAAKGVTSACDADSAPDFIQGYQDARDAGELRMRIYAHVGSHFLDRYIAAGIHTGFGDEWVRIGAVKQYADGSISERTAWLSRPYIGIPNYSGLRLSSRGQLLEVARKAHAAGWQLGTHANGDLAIDEIVGVYEQVQRENPRHDPRFRIEHSTLPTDSAIQRMRALGMIPIPFSCYVYFHGDILHFYGEPRTRRMFPMRSYLDAGLRPPDSSDYTASPSDPMMWLQSQVTRTDYRGTVWGANQRIAVEEAVRCGTAYGAYASFEENLKGTVSPGKLADLVVLGQDPFKVDPSSLIKIPIERTMAGGRWTFES
jgi:predicted amidohydrolase YtcJ